MKRPINLEGMCLLELREITINEWTPERDGKGRPTQVHLVPEAEGLEVQFVMRFKGRKTLDDIVASLNMHADFVFGPKGK